MLVAFRAKPIQGICENCENWENYSEYTFWGKCKITQELTKPKFRCNVPEQK